MDGLSESLKEQLVTIIRQEYENCDFLPAAAQLLTGRIKLLCEEVAMGKPSFTQLRDSIGEIGIFLSNTEKRLSEVEDCYTKLVEALADEKNPAGS